MKEAIQNNDPQAVQKLIDEGVNVNHLDPDGFGWLSLAILKGAYKAADILLANGADINVQNSEGYSLLHIASVRDDKAITYLLAKGINPGLRDTYGLTWLEYRNAKKTA